MPDPPRAHKRTLPQGEGGEPQALHDRILGAFDRHVAGDPLLDDLTLVVVARLA